ncbi:uncharacterized protein J3D65DRAFT_693762, partial [Phyllosticta citribraziliensis]
RLQLSTTGNSTHRNYERVKKHGVQVSLHLNLKPPLAIPAAIPNVYGLPRPSPLPLFSSYSSPQETPYSQWTLAPLLAKAATQSREGEPNAQTRAREKNLIERGFKVARLDGGERERDGGDEVGVAPDAHLVLFLVPGGVDLAPLHPGGDLGLPGHDVRHALRHEVVEGGAHAALADDGWLERQRERRDGGEGVHCSCVGLGWTGLDGLG